MSNRLDNTRAVVFEEDYAPAGKVIYPKKETHYIRKETVEKLKAKGVKMKVSNFDEKGEVEKAKKAQEAANKQE